jgi:hypothetical protein
MSNDEELEKLLGELGQTDPLPSNAEDKDEIYIPAKPRANKPEAISVSIPEPDDMLMFDPSTNSKDKEEHKDLPTIFNDQLKSVVSQYASVFEEIITTYKSDRAQAQEVIDNFMDVIAQGGKIPRVYLEKVADAVRAKNEIAQTAIRALDSLPKLLSATKGNEVFNQVNMSFDSSSLREILEQAEKTELGD